MSIGNSDRMAPGGALPDAVTSLSGTLARPAGLGQFPDDDAGQLLRAITRQVYLVDEKQSIY